MMVVSVGALNSPLPGPRPTPLLGRRGNLLRVGRDPLARLLEIYQGYGAISALVRGDPRLVFALGPEANRRLIAQPESWQSVVDALTAGCSSKVGDQEVSHAARPAHEQGCAPGAAVLREVTVHLTREMIERWGIGCQLDAAYVTRQLTFRIALTVLIGFDITNKVRQTAEARQLATVARQWAERLASAPLPVFTPGRSWQADRRLPHLATQLTMLVAALLSHAGKTLPPTSIGMLGRRVVRLLVAEPAIHAAALSWTLFLLSQHPAILADLRAELADVPRDEAPALEQLAELQLLDQVVKESLRLFPPVASGACVTNAPLELEPYRLPRGATLVYSPYLTQRLPELYLQPRRFRPERWLFIEPGPQAYLPFGAFAGSAAEAIVAGVKLILALIVRRYTLGLAPGARIERGAGLLLAPKAGLPMIIAPPDRPLIKRPAHGNVCDMVDLE